MPFLSSKLLGPRVCKLVCGKDLGDWANMLPKEWTFERLQLDSDVQDIVHRGQTNGGLLPVRPDQVNWWWEALPTHLDTSAHEQKHCAHAQVPPRP